MKKIIVTLLVLMLIGTGIAFAERQDVSNVLLGDAEAAASENWNTDKLVWQTGTIDADAEKGLVVNDIGYRWSPYGTDFRDIDGAILSKGDFDQGTDVTFVLDKDRKTIVTLIRGKIAEEDEAEE